MTREVQGSRFKVQGPASAETEAEAEAETMALAGAVFARIKRQRVGVRTWRKAESGKLKVETNHLRGCPPERGDE